MFGNKKTGLVIIIAVVLVIAGCARVHYLGNVFTPTEQIDIFYSLHEVDKEFTVMGHAVGSGNLLISMRKIQTKMIEEARMCGADAIIFTEVEKTYVPFGDGDEEKMIKASFIKYL